MPDWLQHAVAEKGDLAWEMMAIRLGVAFLMGIVVAAIYALTTRVPGRAMSHTFLATLVLLSVLIALVTMVIGNNVARAFSLVGALSIVRFRTVVEDTRDTAFVIFAVAVGMGAGAGYMVAPLVATPLVFLGALVFGEKRRKREREAVLVVRMGVGHTPGEALAKLLQEHLVFHRLSGLATARGGAAMDLTYAVRPRSAEASLSLVSALSALEGVQSVELKES